MEKTSIVGGIVLHALFYENMQNRTYWEQLKRKPFFSFHCNLIKNYSSDKGVWITRRQRVC